MIAVVDIDGVLADASHRQHFLDGRPRDWDAFFASVGDDTVIQAGCDRVAELAREHRVVLLSGRPERTRADTLAWLDRHGLAADTVVLRPDTDRRPAAIFKAEAIVAIGSPAEVAVVVDDDETVTARLDASGYRTERFR
jgi:hypothetical protein